MLDSLFGNKEPMASPTTMTSLSKGVSNLGTDLKGLFSKGGGFQKSLGSVLGNVGMGMQIGGAIGDIGKALG